MPPNSHILIAANPKSGAASRAALVAELGDQLSQRGFSVTVCDQLDNIQRLSHEYTQAGTLHCVVAAGGDGTAAAVVNLIPHAARLAVFPLGTENLLALYLGLTNEPRSAAEIIHSGRTRTLDAGLANGRLFLVMLGCGFDAEVVAQMALVRRGHINRWSYTKPIWRAVRNYSYPDILVQCLDQPEPGDGQAVCTDSFSTAWLFAFNIPRYAADLQFCPQADGNDGWLDLCGFRRGGLLTGLGYLWKLWRGTHQRMQDFKHMRSRRLRITSSGRVPYQIDGDPGGQLPLDIEVLPNRLTIIAP